MRQSRPLESSLTTPARLWDAPTRWVASLVPRRSVRGPRLVVGSGRAGLTTQHRPAVSKSPESARNQPVNAIHVQAWPKSVIAATPRPRR